MITFIMLCLIAGALWNIEEKLQELLSIKHAETIDRYARSDGNAKKKTKT